MKQLKILTLMLALVLLFSLAACAQEAPKTSMETEGSQATLVTTEEEPTGTFAVILVTDEETSSIPVKRSDLQGESLLDLFFSEGYVDIFEADVTQEDYVMLNSLKGLTPDAAKNEYIAIYTTDKEIADVESAFTQPIEVDGKTYYGANFGVADIAPKNGEAYLFQIATF